MYSSSYFNEESKGTFKELEEKEEEEDELKKEIKKLRLKKREDLSNK